MLRFCSLRSCADNHYPFLAVRVGAVAVLLHASRPTLALADTAVTAPGDAVVGTAALLSLATPTILVSAASATTLDRQLKRGFSEFTGIVSCKSKKTPSFPMCRWGLID